MSRSFKTAGWILLAAFTLSACAFDQVEEAPQPCPDTSILAQGAKLVRFQPGPGRDIIDVAHMEIIDGFDGACEYNVDDSGAGTLIVEISPRIRSERGPANTDDFARFEYFVALTDANGQMITKQRFPVHLAYPGSVAEIVWQDDTPITLSLPIKAGETAAKWRIFLGLQLTRADLDFNLQSR